MSIAKMEVRAIPKAVNMETESEEKQGEKLASKK